TVPVTMTEQSGPPAETGVAICVPAPPRRPVIKPLSAESYALHLSMPVAMRERLRYLQELMSHMIPSGNEQEVIDRSFMIAIEALEKTKFGKTDKPRKPQSRSKKASRYIPKHVKRAVHDRDGGRCTFISASGHRCSQRKFLEYDHVEPFARGGEATI